VAPLNGLTPRLQQLQVPRLLLLVIANTCLPLPPLIPPLLQQRIDQQLRSKSDTAGNASLHERLHQVAIQSAATCFRNVTLLQLQQRKGPKKEWSGNKREMKEKEELEKVASSPAVYVPYSSPHLRWNPV
jgi:hypothetical protein